MSRKPSGTIRVDAQTHAEVRDLAVLYTHRWQRHVTSADIVRMGVTLLNAQLWSEPRRDVQPRSREEDACR
jgi:hypothetical protein